MTPTNAWGDCTGSYTENDVPGAVKHGKARVTGACAVCGRRVAFVTAHALPNRPIVLGRHKPPVAKVVAR